MFCFVCILKMATLRRFVPCAIHGLRMQLRYLSNKDAIFSKPHRLLYARSYPTVLVNPDGSSVMIRYPDPRKIIRLPLDFSTLSEEERKELLERRKPRKKVVIEDDVEDGFSSKRYIKFIKKS